VTLNLDPLASASGPVTITANLFVQNGHSGMLTQ
jgi:hypothetical protein